MEDTGIETSSSNQRIISRENTRGVVEVRKDSKSNGLGNKVASLVLASAALVGVGSVAHASMEVRKSDDGASSLVTDAHAMEPSTSQVNNANNLQIHEQQNVKESSRLFDTVMHDLDADQKIQARLEVDMFKSKIAAKSNYVEVHQEIPLKYQTQIEQTAKMYGISRDSLMGIISVENGGGEDVTNGSSGARGVAQFMPNTATDYGLRVNSEFDERSNPVKSIAAAGKYLEQNKALFGGDEGLAIWSYHAGIGNVFTALKIYFIDVNNIDIGNYGEAKDLQESESIIAKAKQLIAQDKLDISKLLANNAVREKVTSKLEDYSDTYPYQVVAAGELLNEHQSQVTDLGGGLKVTIDRSGASPINNSRP